MSSMTTAEATQLRIPIEGMTCASCVVRVERALTRLVGVEAAYTDRLDHLCQRLLNQVPISTSCRAM
jgi:Cu+-exporting ATPase